MKLTKKEILGRFQRRMTGDYEFRVSESFVLSEWAAKKISTDELKRAIREQLRLIRQRFEDSLHKIGKDLDL